MTTFFAIIRYSSIESVMGGMQMLCTPGGGMVGGKPPPAPPGPPKAVIGRAKIIITTNIQAINRFFMATYLLL